MKSLNPSFLARKIDPEHLKVLQSIDQTINGNIAPTTPLKQDPTAGINKGVYTQFDKGNTTSVFVRVAANGVAGTGAEYNWPVAGALVINHGLLRQPIGVRIVDKDKTVDVFRTAAPDSTQITLQPTDHTASVTLEIF